MMTNLRWLPWIYASQAATLAYSLYILQTPLPKPLTTLIENDWGAVIFASVLCALYALTYRWALRYPEPPDFEPLATGKVAIFGDAMALAVVYDSFHIYVAACRRVRGRRKHGKEL